MMIQVQTFNNNMKHLFLTHQILSQLNIFKKLTVSLYKITRSQPEYHSWKSAHMIIQIKTLNNNFKRIYLTITQNTDATKSTSKKLQYRYT